MVEDRCAAGNVVSARRGAAGVGLKVLRAKSLFCGRGHSRGGRSRRLIIRHQLNLGRVWLRCLRKREESRILIRLERGAIGRKRQVWLIGAEEKEFVLRPDRSAYTE